MPSQKEAPTSGKEAEDLGGIRTPLLVSALLSLFWETGTGNVSNINILIGVSSGSSQPSTDFVCVA